MKMHLFSIQVMFHQMTHEEMKEVFHFLHTHYSEPEMYVLGIHTRLGNHLQPIGASIFGQFMRVSRLFDSYLCVVGNSGDIFYCQNNAWEKVYFIINKEYTI